MVIDLDEKQGFDSPMRSPAQAPRTPAPSGPTMPTGAAANNPVFPVLSYCASSIMMTVTNKFVLSGTGFNLNFFLLCVQVGPRLWERGRGLSANAGQSVVCVIAIQTCKTLGIIQYRDFNSDEARKCELIISLLVQRGSVTDDFQGSRYRSLSLS